jgi:hypothetical protein
MVDGHMKEMSTTIALDEATDFAGIRIPVERQRSRDWRITPRDQ